MEPARFAENPKQKGGVEFQRRKKQHNMNAHEKATDFINALHALEEAEGEAQSEVDAIADLYAPDAKLTNAALKLVGEERQGSDAIRSFWAEYKKTLGKAYSDFHHIAASENTAGLYWVTKASAPDGSDDAVHYDGSTLLEFNDDGKITFFQGYYDTAQLNRQMGLEKG